jgi:type IV secretory pathway TrbD component
MIVPTQFPVMGVVVWVVSVFGVEVWVVSVFGVEVWVVSVFAVQVEHSEYRVIHQANSVTVY